MSKKEYLEVELKYSADDIDRITFKELAKSLSPISFVYVESRDIYYTKDEDEFLRYRMPSFNKLGGGEENRSELTFKKKHKDANNWVRTEVNLRIDGNSPDLIDAFCTGLGYKKAFSIEKSCDVYFFNDHVDLVYYTVKGEDGKYSNFVEIEAMEDANLTQDEAWLLVQKYEKLLAPLGINAQKRKKLSLFELYRK